MNKERDITILTSLIALGIFIVTLLAIYFQSLILIPLAIISLISFVLILFSDKKKISILSENIEKGVFFITIAFIIISFILMYKPI